MRLAAAEPHAWRTSAQRLCKYRLLFCCRTADSQENTKAWHFCFAYDIYTGTDKHGGWGSFQKTLSDWTVTAGLAATLNPFFFPFFCLILAAMFSGGQLVDGHRQAEPINEEEEGRGGRGCSSSHDAPESLITGWISRCRPRGVISLCDSFIVNESSTLGNKGISSFPKKTGAMKSKRFKSKMTQTCKAFYFDKKQNYD